jgi:LacI family transcriptional regulator
MARVLARNTNTRIAIFIPEYSSDQYWVSIKDGIETALKAVHHYGVEGVFFPFKQNSPVDFEVKAEMVLNSKPDAVLLAPIFGQEADMFLKKIEELQIPVVLINTDIDTASRISFVGTHSYQSGVLAGKLFRISPWDKILVLHLETDPQHAHHLLAKQNGLEEACKESEPTVEVITISVDHFKEANYLEKIISQLKEKEKVSGVFVSSSRAYLIAEAVKHLFPHIQIIGFDLIDPNVKLLQNQYIDVLLNQNPDQQGYFGILNLVNHIIFNKPVPEKQFLPIDIVLPENAQFYLDRKNMVMAV